MDNSTQPMNFHVLSTTELTSKLLAYLIDAKSANSLNSAIDLLSLLSEDTFTIDAKNKAKMNKYYSPFQSNLLIFTMLPDSEKAKLIKKVFFSIVLKLILEENIFSSVESLLFAQTNTEEDSYSFQTLNAISQITDIPVEKIIQFLSFDFFSNLLLACYSADPYNPLELVISEYNVALSNKHSRLKDIFLLLLEELLFTFSKTQPAATKLLRSLVRGRHLFRDGEASVTDRKKERDVVIQLEIDAFEKNFSNGVLRKRIAVFLEQVKSKVIKGLSRESFSASVILEYFCENHGKVVGDSGGKTRALSIALFVNDMTRLMEKTSDKELLGGWKNVVTAYRESMGETDTVIVELEEKGVVDYMDVVFESTVDKLICFMMFSDVNLEKVGEDISATLLGYISWEEKCFLKGLYGCDGFKAMEMALMKNKDDTKYQLDTAGIILRRLNKIKRV